MSQIEFSGDVQGRNLKLMLWGAPASRKTESILRYFPDVLLIDCEGNSDHCIGMPEIPDFLRVITKDVYEILDVLDQVAAGEIRFPDDRPVQTVGIDGASVLWSVRQEMGSLLAEKRAIKRAKGAVDPDEVHMTQLDWVVAKRPMKRLHARMNNPGVKYFIVTARSKDLWEEVVSQGRKELKKVGLTADAMRGLDFEVNMVLQMFNTVPWKAEVIKVQGALGTLFPVGTELSQFPASELLAYATGGGSAVEDEITVAEQQAERETGRTQHKLLEIGKKQGLGAKDVAEALKRENLTFEADNWKKMVEVIEAYEPSASN